MIKSLVLFISFSIFLSGCSLFRGDKEARGPVADGLTPKALYELSEDKFSSGSIEQGIEQLEIILVCSVNRNLCINYLAWITTCL